MTHQMPGGLRPGDYVGQLGVVAGLARKAYRKAPMELLDQAEITEVGGITGDHRGVRKPGSLGKRQVTLMERAGWDAAMAAVGHDLPWWERRCNMVVDGFDLPREPGALLRLGANVVLEMTRFTDPCERMEQLAPGLFTALKEDWRGGICTRVVQGGTVLVGDVIRLEGLA